MSRIMQPDFSLSPTDALRGHNLSDELTLKTRLRKAGVERLYHPYN